MSESVGNIMKEGQTKALKTLAIVAGMFVYLGMIAYSAVHNWRLLTAGIDPDMVMWAALGVIALEITAVFLPIAIHFWTHAPLQRIAAFAFYVLDLGLIFFNVILSYSIGTGNLAAMPAWLEMYLRFVVPATPLIVGALWSLLFLLDPSAKERGTIEALKASTRAALANRIANRAKAADISEAVDQAADIYAREIISGTLGIEVSTNGHKPRVYASETDRKNEVREGVRK